MFYASFGSAVNDTVSCPQKKKKKKKKKKNRLQIKGAVCTDHYRF